MKNGVHVTMKTTTTMQSVFANRKSYNNKKNSVDVNRFVDY